MTALHHAVKAVTFWGTYDSDKPRVRLLREGLAENGYAVEEININVWTGVRDKSQVKSLGARAKIAWRLVCAYPVLVTRLIKSRSSSVVVVPYLGQLDILVLWIFSKLLAKIVVLDVFISLYDTIVFDRKLSHEGSVFSNIVKILEKFAIGCADLSIIDTAAHARRLERLFGFSDKQLGHVFVGVEEAMFAAAQPERRQGVHGPLRVLFYGQMSPLHGIETILEAAQLVGPEIMELTIIGTGQEDDRVESLLNAMNRPVTWLKWEPYAGLRGRILDADVCLGIFGQSEKAASVIPNKVFQIAAVGRYIVTRDGPGIRELFSPDDPGITLVPPADPAALASVLTELSGRLSELRGEVFHAAIRPRIAPLAVGRELAHQIERLCEERVRP